MESEDGNQVIQFYITEFMENWDKRNFSNEHDNMDMPSLLSVDILRQWRSESGIGNNVPIQLQNWMKVSSRKVELQSNSAEIVRLLQSRL